MAKMNLEKHVTPPTIQQIFEHYERKATSPHRMHLGGSQIGNECSRALWYQFRWMDRPKFDGRMLRLFETGDKEEDRLIADLRAIGVTVWSRDPETGKQFKAEAHGGHFGLSIDGIGSGFDESKQSHVLEFKTMNQKAFDDIRKKGLEQSKPIYWAQVQVGMALMGLERAYFFAVNKNTDEIYGERVKLRVREADALLERAGDIIFRDDPPPKLSYDPSFWKCKFCSYRDVCHLGMLPEVNCRTCLHVTAMADGSWHCAKHDTTLDEDRQRRGCTDHLWNPHAMPWPVADAGEDYVEYDTACGPMVNRNSTIVERLKGDE